MMVDIEAIKTKALQHDFCIYSGFYDMMVKRGFERMAEIGVWKGHGVIHLAKKMKELYPDKDFKVYAIDLFDDLVNYPDYAMEFSKHNLSLLRFYYDYNIKESGVSDYIITMKGKSPEIADSFENESLDMVFLDANHAYESVIKDIDAWYPKVKKGGIFSGHDYIDSQPGVVKAVKERFGKVKFDKGYTWYVEVRNEVS
jgi:hypothetical protein